MKIISIQRFIIAVGLAVSSLTACSPLKATPPGPAMELSDCQLTSPGGSIQARCGIFAVPEDRGNPGSRKISLNVAIVPAVNRSAEPDPLFILAGGPGQSAVEIGPAIISALERVHQSRAIVFVDQRGTGKSNPLRCSLPEDSDASLTTEAAIQILQACPAKLDADLRFYTTPIAMQDLDEVRSALGYDQIDIYGGSYGTRAALTYLRMYPDHVRTIILDGVVSPDYVLYLNTAQDAERALVLAFNRCQADQNCQAAFPGLESEFNELLQKVAAGPIPISMDDPLTGKPLSFDLTMDIFSGSVFALLYTPETVSLLPLAIHTAAKEGNFAPLVSQAIQLDAGLYDGMFYAVTCSEDAPLVQPSLSASLAQGTRFGDRTTVMIAVCQKWPKTELPPDFRAPLPKGLATPVLILSGEADPVTPPAYGEKVAQMLPNSLHLVIPGMGHGNATRGCLPRVLADFIQRGSVKDLDTTCVQKIVPAPFFINFTGPQP